MSFVFFAGNAHDESQPIHLKVADPSVCVTRCTREYGNPCENFCPAGVYEMVADGAGGRRLQINAANCVHCKACDIKDPYADHHLDHAGRRLGAQLPEPVARIGRIKAARILRPDRTGWRRA